MMTFKRIREFKTALVHRKNALCILLLSTLLALFPSHAMTNEGSHEQKPQKKRVAQMLSKSLYKKMILVQEAIQAQNYEQALDQLNSILERKDRLREYDLAKTYEMFANVHLTQSHYLQAITYSQKALNVQALNEESEQQIYHRLIYLYFFIEDYNNAMHYVRHWFSINPSPEIKTYFTAAQVFAAGGQLENALQYGLKGLDLLGNNSNIQIKESWIKLVIAIQLNLKDYKNVIPHLEYAISQWPQQVNYYLQLSAVHQELNQALEAFAVLSLAEKNNLIKKKSEFKRLLQQYRYHNYPAKGATIHSTQLNSMKGISHEDWDSNAKAWLQARERSYAEQALKRASQLSSSGTYSLELCKTMAQTDQWEGADNHCQSAVDKGGLTESDIADAHYLIALAKFYQGNFQNALITFQTCANLPTTKNECTRWQAHVRQVIANKKTDALHQAEAAQLRQRRKHNQNQLVEQALLRKI